jgi:hypothetical protein
MHTARAVKIAIIGIPIDIDAREILLLLPVSGGSRIKSEHAQKRSKLPGQ